MKTSKLSQRQLKQITSLFGESTPIPKVKLVRLNSNNFYVRHDPDAETEYELLLVTSLDLWWFSFGYRYINGQLLPEITKHRPVKLTKYGVILRIDTDRTYHQQVFKKGERSFSPTMPDALRAALKNDQILVERAKRSCVGHIIKPDDALRRILNDQLVQVADMHPGVDEVGLAFGPAHNHPE